MQLAAELKSITERSIPEKSINAPLDPGVAAAHKGFGMARAKGLNAYVPPPGASAAAPGCRRRRRHHHHHHHHRHRPHPLPDRLLSGICGGGVTQLRVVLGQY